MDNVRPIRGGKKYKSPENMQERQELHRLLRELDVTAFRTFIDASIPELKKAGWLEKTDEQLFLLMHEMRSQFIGFGEEFYKSRNFLRAKQFGYSEEELESKPVCANCRWYREAPSKKEKSCMHLGGVPQDIACRGFSKT